MVLDLLTPRRCYNNLTVLDLRSMELPCDLDQMNAQQLRDLTACLIQTVNQQRARAFTNATRQPNRRVVAAPMDRRALLSGTELMRC